MWCYIARFKPGLRLDDPIINVGWLSDLIVILLAIKNAAT